MKRILYLLVAVLCAQLSFAEGTEGFENIGKRYYDVTTISYTGDNGQSWQIVGASDYKISGTYGAVLYAYAAAGNGITGSMTAAQKSDGVGTVTFQAKACFASSAACWGARSFKVQFGGVEKIVTETITVANQAVTYSVDFNLSGSQLTNANIKISLVGVVSGEPAYCVDNLSWTSCTGRPDAPTMTVNAYQDDISKVYWGQSATTSFASTTEGSLFYYTTDGSVPTTSSTQASSFVLPMNQTTTVNVIAYKADMGCSDVSTFVVDVRKGIVNSNPFVEAFRSGWESSKGTVALNTSTTKATTSSGVPVLDFKTKGSTAVTEAYVNPQALSFYVGGTATKIAVAAKYQTGTYEIKNGVRTWVGDSESWTEIGTARMKAGNMKRFDFSIPSAIMNKVVRFQLVDSSYAFVDDFTAVSEDYVQAQTPSISVAEGEVSAGTLVSLSAETGSTIYYSLNGGAYSVYSAPIAINTTTELRAYAEKTGCVRSWITRADYTVSTGELPKLNIPTVSVPSGNVNYGTQIEIRCGSSENLHYSINGIEQTRCVGTTTVTVSGESGATYSISAYVTRDGYTTSDTVYAVYTVVYPKLSSPIFSIEGGTVSYGTKVTITAPNATDLVWCKVGDASYNQRLGSYEVTVKESTTISAYVTHEGHTQSDIVSHVYTVQKETYQTPTFSLADNDVVPVGTMLTISAGAGATLTYTVNGISDTAIGMAIIPITEDVIITAFAIKDGYNQSAIATLHLTVARTDAPVISPNGGSVEYGSNVTITAAQTTDTIYYRKDMGLWKLAVGSVQIGINESQTISAFAARENALPSDTIQASFEVPSCGTPTFSIPGGNVYEGQQVTISKASDELLHYTINGGTELTSSQAVTITINETTTIVAWTTRSGYAPSVNVSATYNVIAATQLMDPEFSLPSGEYVAGTSITLSAAEGATIHYTINEQPEQTALTEVLLTLTENMEISAYATMAGYTQSQTVQAAFYVRDDSPTTLEDRAVQKSSRKLLINGQLLIETPDGSRWTVLGTRVR